MTVDDKIFTTVIRMETKQDAMLVDLADIKTKVSILPCEVNTLKINTVRKIVYGAITVVLLAFMANLATPVKSAIIKIEKAPIESSANPGIKTLIKCDKNSDDKINQS